MLIVVPVYTMMIIILVLLIIVIIIIIINGCRVLAEGSQNLSELSRLMASRIDQETVQEDKLKRNI